MNGPYVVLASTTDTYTALVRERCENVDYRVRFHATAASQTELFLIKVLLVGSSAQNFDHDNVRLMREQGGAVESMPLLVQLVQHYQAFNEAQRAVRMDNIRPIGDALIGIYDRFTPTFALLREVALLELSAATGEDRDTEWANLCQSKVYRALEGIEPKLVASLTAEHAWSQLLRRIAELTQDFKRAQTPLGFMRVSIKSRGRRR